jgi:predicted peroxiredoxin
LPPKNGCTPSGSQCWRCCAISRVVRVARGLPRSRYVDGVEILYISTNGSADATKASIPWHFVVNGSIEVGQTARIVLAGDASEIVKADVRAALEGVGVPPLRDLVAKAKANGVPIHV